MEQEATARERDMATTRDKLGHSGFEASDEVGEADLKDL